MAKTPKTEDAATLSKPLTVAAAEAELQAKAAEAEVAEAEAAAKAAKSVAQAAAAAAAAAADDKVLAFADGKDRVTATAPPDEPETVVHIVPDYIMDVAKLAHEANRAYCAALGDMSQLPWADAPEWQKSSAVNGVLYVESTENVTPGDSHRSWLAEKEREGWTYGPVKDATAKQHPCFVPFEELPVDQQAKDHIFLGVVRAGLAVFCDIDAYDDVEMETAPATDPASNSFFWAMDQVAAGEVVTRAAWDGQVGVYLSDTKNAGQSQLTDEDRTATDWVTIKLF